MKTKQSRKQMENSRTGKIVQLILRLKLGLGVRVEKEADGDFLCAQRLQFNSLANVGL